MCTPRNRQIICKHLQMCQLLVMQLNTDPPAPSKDRHGAGNVVGNQVEAAEVDSLLLKIIREI